MRTMGPNELKGLAATFRELNLSYEEFGKALSGVVDIVRPLKRLIVDQEGKAKGSRLIAAGIVLIAFPDPTISDIVGTGLVAAGLIQNKMRQTTVADVYKEFRKVIGRVDEITQELTY